MIVNTSQPGNELKLYMLLLGATPPGRNVEQHDFFFGIGRSLKELVPDMIAFWPEAGDSLHIDGWREVNRVDGYTIRPVLKTDSMATPSGNKLFLLNLGGYIPGMLAEQHHTMLSVQDDKAKAVKEAKKTAFFKTSSIKGGNSHIDEQYGLDVDDVHRVEDILTPAHRELYRLEITPAAPLQEDELHLGYFMLKKLR